MIGVRTLTRELERASPLLVWINLAVSLGYGVAWAYRFYQEHLAPPHGDMMNRGSGMIQELVVAPRRQRENESRIHRQEMENFANVHPEIASSSQISSHRENETNPVASTSDRIELIDLTEDPSENQENSRHKGDHATQTTRLSPDARPDEMIGNDSRSDNVLNSIDTNLIDGIEMASTSMSLESTDSNNGIIRDIYNECFICALPLDDTRKPVATLPFCMHPFHKTCLDGVLKWHQRCPVCDYHIFSPI